MQIVRDAYTQVEYSSIESSGVALGQTIIQYEVRRYNDMRNLTNVPSYIITCTQRLILPNPTPYTPQVATNCSYNDYPGLIANEIKISDPNKTLESSILSFYSPRTLNTAVTTDQNLATSSSGSTTHQYTTGSSTSQTNTYSSSGSVGLFGEALTGGGEWGHSHSTTTENFHSRTSGSSVSYGSQLSNSDGMTIKDWGCYASIDMNNQTPTWTWGQEYPWNIIEFTDEIGTTGNINLPTYIQDRLYSDGILNPPSELALFGVDFTAKATWIVTPIAPFAGSGSFAFVHTLTYGAATHKLDSDNTLIATLDVYSPITYTPQMLDLPLLALDPLSQGSRRAAVIGFLPNKFDVAPDANGDDFAITSDTNDLLIRGQGFNGALSTDFSVGPTQLTLYFKVVDTAADLSLAIKHWTGNNTAVQLSIAINNTTPITKFADAPETSSGGDNVTIVALRNRDFSSVDYCDWLQPGLNSITISFAPITAGNPSSFYQILAAAIE